MRFRLSSALTIAALAGVAHAQNFNIDVSDLTGSPANTYGAATGQVGHWNVLTGGPPYAASLNNLANAPTTVTTNVVAVGNGTGDFSFNNPGTGGNDEFLMDDMQDVGNGGTVPPSETTWTFSGLNPVNYDITVYSWAPDNATFVSTISECGSGVAQVCGGAWPGGFVAGTTHVQLSACATGGTIEICVNSGAVSGNFSSVNGYQFTETGGTCGGSGTPQCFGSASCPCGNNSTNNGGCDNSLAGVRRRPALLRSERRALRHVPAGRQHHEHRHRQPDRRQLAPDLRHRPERREPRPRQHALLSVVVPRSERRTVRGGLQPVERPLGHLERMMR